MKDALKFTPHPAYANPKSSATIMRAGIEQDEVLMVGDPDKGTNVLFNLIAENDGKDRPRMFPLGKPSSEKKIFAALKLLF